MALIFWRLYLCLFPANDYILCMYMLVNNTESFNLWSWDPAKDLLASQCSQCIRIVYWTSLPETILRFGKNNRKASGKLALWGGGKSTWKLGPLILNVKLISAVYHSIMINCIFSDCCIKVTVLLEYFNLSLTMQLHWEGVLKLIFQGKILKTTKIYKKCTLIVKTKVLSTYLILSNIIHCSMHRIYPSSCWCNKSVFWCLY